jgi:tetratricopeptide (TPR) repeat protein
MILKKLLVSAAAIGSTALPAQQAANAVRPSEQIAAEACTPPSAPAKAPEAETPPLLLSGLGYAGVQPDTASKDAVAWFKQGVRLVWAFDEAEAVRSFQMAQRLDPNCALCFWGEAWARGPTINLRPRTEELEKARTAAARAAELGTKLSERDRLLVDAMVLRTGGEKKFDHLTYASRLETAALRMPHDNLLSVLAADGRMVAQMPREFKPGSLTQRLLERVLARAPEHGGAIHYYIHLTDWIDRSYLAVPHAERLGRIAPAASHLVHMPSHSFYGVGRYKDAAAVNVAAIAADQAFVRKVRPPASGYRTGLLAHNMHFAINSALMRGDGATAVATASQFRAAYGGRTEGGYRILGSATFYTAGLHDDVASVLALPEDKQVLSQAFRHYARGEAQARRGDAPAVQQEAKAIAAILDSDRSVQLGSKTAETLVKVLRHVLEGRASMIAGDHKAAADAYFKGMQAQAAGNFSSDPPLFWYPVRRSYAAALLAAGERERAREHLHATLRRWPRDPLSLYALSLADRRLGNNAAADRNLARARAEWHGDVGAVELWRI